MNGERGAPPVGKLMALIFQGAPPVGKHIQQLVYLDLNLVVEDVQEQEEQEVQLLPFPPY